MFTVYAMLDMFEEEMTFSGRVHLYHPDRKGHFYVFESRGCDDDETMRLPLFVFYISPTAEYAVRRVFDSLSHVHTYLTRLCREGWRLNEDELVELDIPKFTRTPWQECHRIRIAPAKDSWWSCLFRKFSGGFKKKIFCQRQRCYRH